MGPYKEVKSTQKKNSQVVKNGAALKSLGEKGCEIKGGGQEIAAMMLMLINFLTMTVCGWGGDSCT